MDSLAQFKVMLEKAEETRKQNARLQQENKELRDRMQEVCEENEDLRTAVQYGHRIIAKNSKRDEDMQEVFSRVLSRASDRPTTQARAQEVQTLIPAIDDSQSVHEEQPAPKRETAASTVATSAASGMSLLDELPYEIGLVAEIAEDGSLIYHEHSLQPPSQVLNNITNYVSGAHELSGRTKSGKWKKWFTSTTHCVATHLWGGSTNWVDKVPGRFSCKSCFVQKRACVLLDMRTQKLAVLPLPPSVRPSAALAGADDYYITTRETNRRTRLPDGPWATEPTLKRDLSALSD